MRREGRDEEVIRLRENEEGRGGLPCVGVLLLSVTPMNELLVDCSHAGQLSWVIYLISSVIGGRISYTEGEETDHLDGQLIIRVLTLMNYTDRHVDKVGGATGRVGL